MPAHRRTAVAAMARPRSRPDEPLSQMASHHAHVLHLQRTIGNTRTTALFSSHTRLTSPTLLAAPGLAVQRQPKPPNPVDQAGRTLRDFEAWADDEKKRQNVIDKAAVVGLDPRQAASVRAAAAKLAAYAPTMLASANKADPSIASLQSAIALAKQANAKMSGDQADRAEGASLRKLSREAVTRAHSQVSGIDAGIDVKGLVKNLKAIEAALDGGNSLNEILKYLSRTVTDLEKVRTEALARANSAKRIDVLLRGFLALNNPAFPAPPTAAEIAEVRPQLSGALQDEFVAVFDNAVDYDFFTEFANTWGQQLEAREQMRAATGRPPPVIPSQADAQLYFAALRSKSNAEVFSAYTSFASAFFVHRGIASVADLRRSAADLFAARATITGRRGMVCTGFATMGAEALSRTGATLNGYSVGIRASDDMVRADQLDEQGHAIARMNRNGTAFCVSNQQVEQTTNALTGPGAISWGTPGNPAFIGDGRTMDAAVDDLLEKVAARKRKLQKGGK